MFIQQPTETIAILERAHHVEVSTIDAGDYYQFVVMDDDENTIAVSRGMWQDKEEAIVKGYDYIKRMFGKIFGDYQYRRIVLN